MEHESLDLVRAVRAKWTRYLVVRPFKRTIAAVPEGLGSRKDTGTSDGVSGIKSTTCLQEYGHSVKLLGSHCCSKPCSNTRLAITYRDHNTNHIESAVAPAIPLALASKRSLRLARRARTTAATVLQNASLRA